MFLRLWWDLWTKDPSGWCSYHNDTGQCFTWDRERFSLNTMRLRTPNCQQKKNHGVWWWLCNVGWVYVEKTVLNEQGIKSWELRWPLLVEICSHLCTPHQKKMATFRRKNAPCHQWPKLVRINLCRFLETFNEWFIYEPPPHPNRSFMRRGREVCLQARSCIYKYLGAVNRFRKDISQHLSTSFGINAKGGCSTSPG